MTEFLNQNAYRSYPFVEDRTPAQDGFDIPNSTVLDFRAQLWTQASTSCRLAEIEVDKSGAYTVLRFRFLWAAGLESEFEVPETAATPFAVADAIAGVVRAKAVFGPGIQDLVALDAGTYAVTQHDIEPALTTLWPLQLLRVKGQTLASQWLTGDVVVESGRNCNVRIKGNAVVVTVAPGANPGAPVTGALDDDAILRINGLTPGADGDFEIRGGPGVKAYPNPETTHEVVIESRTELREEICNV